MTPRSTGKKKARVEEQFSPAQREYVRVRFMCGDSLDDIGETNPFVFGIVECEAALREDERIRRVLPAKRRKK